MIQLLLNMSTTDYSNASGNYVLIRSNHVSCFILLIENVGTSPKILSKNGVNLSLFIEPLGS